MNIHVNVDPENLHRDSSCLWPDIGQCRIPPEFYLHVGSPVYQNKKHNNVHVYLVIFPWSILNHKNIKLETF